MFDPGCGADWDAIHRAEIEALDRHNRKIAEKERKKIQSVLLEKEELCRDIEATIREMEELRKLPYISFSDISSDLYRKTVTFTPFLNSTFNFEYILAKYPQLNHDIEKAKYLPKFNFIFEYLDVAYEFAKSKTKDKRYDGYVLMLLVSQWFFKGIYAVKEEYDSPCPLVLVSNPVSAAEAALFLYKKLESQNDSIVIKAVAGAYIVILESLLAAESDNPEYKRKERVTDELSKARIELFYEVVCGEGSNKKDLMDFIARASFPERAMLHWLAGYSHLASKYDRTEQKLLEKQSRTLSALQNKASEIVNIFKQFCEFEDKLAAENNVNSNQTVASQAASAAISVGTKVLTPQRKTIEETRDEIRIVGHGGPIHHPRSPTLRRGP